MKRLLLLAIAFIGLFVCLSSNVNAQGVGINSSGSPADPSAILDVSSTSRGFVLPRMTTAQRNAISSPIEGLQIFNITTKCFEAYVNNVWSIISCPCPTPVAPTAGTNTATATQVAWNWNAVSGATGYKYNTVNTYSIATDNLINTSYTQTGLTCGTAYTLYVWAYNACGNSSSTTLNQTTSGCFNCGGSFTDNRDNKTYSTVLIGSQCWMAQNLDYGIRINSSSDQTNNSTAEKYCYNDDNNYCNTCGGLYQWGELVQYFNGADNTTWWNPIPTGNVQGICPAGWHIPTDAEWCTMENSAEAGTDPGCNIEEWRGITTGGRLKETGTAHWNSPNSGATNSTGFTAFGGGIFFGGSFYFFGVYGGWWSASPKSSQEARMRYLNYAEAGVSRDFKGKGSYGFNVRCLLD